MAEYWHVIVFSLIGGIFSLIGGLFLLSKASFAKKFATYATPFAAGTLLATVFIDLLPEAVEQDSADVVMMAALIGMVTFFFLQRFLHWFHHHSHSHHEVSISDPKVGLIVLGDTLHNALDGVAIAAAFLINVPTGIITTLAVATHEIPQEIGDMGLLLARGMRRKKIIIVNIFSALATTVTAVIVFALGSQEALPIGVLLGVSAGFLLYIAASDIIPSLHEDYQKKGRRFDWQAFLLLAGILVAGVSINVSHQFVTEENHDQNSASSSQEAPNEESCNYTSGNYQASTCNTQSTQ